MRKIAEYLTTKAEAQKILEVYGIPSDIVKTGGLAADRVPPAELYMTLTKEATVKVYGLDGSVHETVERHTSYIPLVGSPAELKTVKLASFAPNTIGKFEHGTEMTEPIKLSKTIVGESRLEFFGYGVRSGIKVAGLLDTSGKVSELKIRQTQNGAFMLVPGDWQFTATTKTAAAQPRADETIRFANSKFVLKKAGQLIPLDQEKLKVKLAALGVTDDKLVQSIVNNLKSGAVLHVQYDHVKQASEQRKPLSIYRPMLRKIAVVLSELPEDVANIAIELGKLELTPERLQDALQVVTDAIERLIVVYWDALEQDGEPGALDAEQLRNIIIDLDKLKTELENQYTLQKGVV
jgi:hypothetical protein